MPSPYRQLPRASATGTVSRKAPVSPTASAVVYSPVTSPIRSGKCSRTSDGISTFAIAIPATATSERARNAASWSTRARPPSPTTTPSRASIVTRCGPSRRAAAGATAPKIANASTGSQVSSPAEAGPMSSASRSSSRTGPTLTAAGRRLSESSRIATRTRAVERRVTGGRLSSVRHISDTERRARLAQRHALAPGHRAADSEAATRAVTVLHSTEPATVYLSLWARVDGVTVADVDRALYDDRSLVKQLAMRRTLFVFPRDLLPGVWGSASARVADQLETRLVKEVEAAGHAEDGARWLASVREAVLEALAGTALTAQ